MNDTPDPSQPAQESLWRSTPWLSRLAVLLGVAVILAVGIYFARPAYRSLKDWRSRRLSATAESLMARDEWKQALEKAQAARTLSPTQPAAIRALAKVCMHETNAAALSLWQQLIYQGQATGEERRKFVDLAIRFDALDLAIGELDKLLKQEPNHATNLWLAAQLYGAAGQYAQTVYFAARAKLNAPENKQYQFFHARLVFDAPDASQRSAARNDLWTLARGDGPVSLDALRYLSTRRDLKPGEGRELIHLLRQHPAGGISEQLLALDQQLLLEPQRRTEIFDQCVVQANAAPLGSQSDYAVWLNQHREFERTRTILPLEKALERKERFIPLMDALGGLGRWEEIAAILEKQRPPLEQTYMAAFQARCAIQLGQTNVVNVYWQRALSNARNRPDQLVWLSQYAEKCGAVSVARDACRALFSCVADLRAAYRLLAQLTERTGSTEELRDLLGLMRKTWPQDDNLRNDHTYLNLLLQTELAPSRQDAEALAKKSPEKFPFRTTLALARIRSNEPATALQLYEGRSFDWRLAMPGQRAVYAAVLAANGRRNEARELAGSIPRDRLRKEEFELIRALSGAE